MKRNAPLLRRTPLRRSNKPIARSPIRRVSKKRSGQLREYSKRRAIFLALHPVCEVWCAENWWEWIPAPPGCGPWYRRVGDESGSAVNDNVLLNNHGAPRADQVHHKNKRRGEMLLDEAFWLAVCDEKHKRIENNLAWARERGFSLNF